MFIFKGINSKSKNITISGMPPVPTPQRRKEKIYIDGRDGYLSYDNNSWDEFTLNFEFHADTEDIDDIKAWLTGQGELVHRDYLDRYFRAEIVNEVLVEKIIGTIYRCAVFFSCQPDAYLLSGKTVINGTTSVEFNNNPVAGDSYPIITVKGLTTTNEITVTSSFTGAPQRMLKITPKYISDLIIDTENEIAYQINGGEKIAVSTIGEYPKFTTVKGGSGTVSVSPELQLSIVPNWSLLP